MPEWADSPADWEAILAVLISASLILGYLIRAEMKRNTKATEANGAQMIPNHGTSLRDAVDRIEKRMTEIHIDVRAVDSKLSHHIDWHMDKEQP